MSYPSSGLTCSAVCSSPTHWASAHWPRLATPGNASAGWATVANTSCAWAWPHGTRATLATSPAASESGFRQSPRRRSNTDHVPALVTAPLASRADEPLPLHAASAVIEADLVLEPEVAV